MSRRNKITVVSVSDNHYLPMLAALIKSIEANLDADTMLDMWIVDDGLTKKNINKLTRSVHPHITQLNWKKVNEVIPHGVKLPVDKSSWPQNIYLRFFIPGVMPPGVNKMLYLDVDIINCRDLTELYRVEMGDHIIAAIQDPRLKTFDNSWGGVLNHIDLGFAGNTKYFNSGLMLIDVKYWKQNNIAEKALECLGKNIRYAIYPDQYALNVVLAGQWFQLDPAWNHFATAFSEHPYNIHFVDRKPIYKSYSNDGALRDIFYHYLNQTEWKRSKPVGELKRYAKKISNILLKINRLIFK